MKQIESYEWLKEKINGHRTRKSHSNFFFLTQKIQAMIAEGKLFFQEDGQNLFLFERESEFYRMYYFLGDLGSAPEIRTDVPVVIEFPYRGAYSPAQKQEAEYIQRLGFEPVKQSRTMSVQAENVILPPLLSDSNIVIQTAGQGESEQIIELLNDSFDKRFSFLPDRAELLRLIDAKRIMTLYYDDTLVGVIDVELRGKTIWVWHFTVNQAYRQKGLAKALLTHVIRLHRDRVQEFALWVDMDNTPAVRLYQKTGYTFSAKGADEYILQCKG